MNPTASSEARRQLAARIAPAYSANEKVAAVLLAGSSARGDADRFSDIEIGVFWYEPPTDAERRQGVERAQGDLHRLYPYDPSGEAWADDWKIGRDLQHRPFSGISIDMLHVLVATVEKTIDSVVKQFDPDVAKQNLIAAIRTGICAHGEHLVTRWRRETDVYPAELMRAVIQRYAQIDHFWRLAMWRERGDLTGVHGKIVATHGVILQVLLAINSVYYFGVKHRDTLIRQLNIAPADLSGRMDACFDTNLVAGEEVLRLLIEEVYDLIERHVPRIDVERLRTIFRYRRPPWDGSPPK